MSIPLSYIVTVTPGVISAGASVNSLPCVMLSNNALVPAGGGIPFTSPESVGNFLGFTSAEYTLAANYFSGFTNSPRKPSKLYIARYTSDPVPAQLVGGALSSTFQQVKALKGDLTVSIDGKAHTASALDFSAAKSLSEVATKIEAGLSAGKVSYSSGTQGFTISSTSTDASSAVAFASGSLAASLGLTAETGASQYQVLTDTSAAGQLTAIKNKTDMSIMFFAFDPSTIFLSVGAWVAAQNSDVLALMHDTTVTPALLSAGTSLAQQATAASYNGVAPVYSDPAVCALLASIAGSVDWTATNGRYNAAFRRQSGISPSVDDGSLATQLEDAGYNFYGAIAGSGASYNCVYPGTVIGSYKWIDSFLNQMWLRRSFQLALVDLLVNKGQIPYNSEGDALVASALQAPISAALNFGAIRTGVVLSEQQTQEVTLALANNAAQTIQTSGYYLSVKASTADATVRAKRATPTCVFYYTDGQSVQRLNIPAYEVE